MKLIHKQLLLQDNMYCLPTAGMIYGTQLDPTRAIQMERHEESTSPCRPSLLLSDEGNKYGQDFHLGVLIEVVKHPLHARS